MAKLAIVCTRNAARLSSLARRMSTFLRAVAPEDVDAPVHVSDDGTGAVLGVYDPTALDTIHDQSAYVGWIARRSRATWHEAGSPPIGTYALVRTDARTVELQADAVASRTLWYACTPDLFVASTSQRAIPWFLGGFDANPQALAWMLASGSIGWRQSWDRRAKPLGPGGTLRLDRSTWRVDVDEPEVRIAPDHGDHRTRLESALDGVLSDLGVDWARWRLALSGGNDSRAILQRLRDHRVECVTWGLAAAPWDSRSDAAIARRLAAHHGVGFTYFATDLVTDDVAGVLARFARHGEGRVDHVSAYLDGFALWRALHDSGVRGVIRGDEPFGRHPMLRLDDVCPGLGLHRWNDYSTPVPLADLGLEAPELPAELRYRWGETTDAWRDRLVHTYRLPTVLAALNELKSAYVEIANPLLAQPIVAIARSLPDELRTDKRLFRALTRPDLPLARRGAIASADELNVHAVLRRVLREEVASTRTRLNFGAAYARWLGALLAQPVAAEPAASAPWRRAVGGLLPRDLRRRISPPPPKRVLRPVQLGVRTFLVNEMLERLAADGRAADTEFRAA